MNDEFLEDLYLNVSRHGEKRLRKRFPIIPWPKKKNEFDDFLSSIMSYPDIVDIYNKGLHAGSVRFMYKGQAGRLKVRMQPPELIVATAFTEYMHRTEEWGCGNFSIDLIQPRDKILKLWDNILRIMKRK